jgi:arsenate reductase (glutaredoxin)
MGTEVILWHNPRCSTSRKALAILNDHGVAPALRQYIQDPPTYAEIDDLLATLVGMEPHELIRTKEPEYRSLGLSPTTPRTALIDAIARHPRLLERPILVVGRRAVIGRPAERVVDILP